eukprot:TRINITY_DN18590_c0_g1_i1.p1 TRINITY_DN18590_c0_g1~~TRINITY_DN18590_c0_g1_i1.p1  ORF type:complete len:155 (+),score=7.75 TRINITY_DN18590_c0_g1_i1:32-466(+)
MWIRDRYQRRVRGNQQGGTAVILSGMIRLHRAGMALALMGAMLIAVLPLNAHAEGRVILTVSGIHAETGDAVEVDLSLQNIAALESAWIPETVRITRPSAWAFNGNTAISMAPIRASAIPARCKRIIPESITAVPPCWFPRTLR